MGFLDDCTVWRWRGDATPAAAAAVLDAEERDRALTLDREADRVRSATGAGLLRLAAASFVLGGLAMYDVPLLARTLKVDRTCATCGKPHGRPDVGIRRLHVSVAHTGTDEESVVLIAVSSAGPVGVDAETVTDRDFSPMTSLVLSPAELKAGPPEEQLDWFTVWARKEAVLKATGDGLRTPMSEVVLGPGPSLVSYAGETQDCDLQDLGLGDDLAAAVAVLNPQRPVVIRIKDASELLG